jgi:hypothetical protein
MLYENVWKNPNEGLTTIPEKSKINKLTISNTCKANLTGCARKILFFIEFMCR